MKTIISLILILSFIILSGIVVRKYEAFKHNLPSAQPAYFDFFIAHTFFDQDNIPVWDEQDTTQTMPIEWLFNETDFEKLDSVYFGFKNTTGEKIYYLTWGQPNSYIKHHFVVYEQEKVDSIPFNNFGCGTGVYATPLKNNKIAASNTLNPLLFNPYTNYPLPLRSKKFPTLFRQLYGDSVAITFEQLVYSLPWNKYPTQYISSDEIVVSTEKVLANWENGYFSLLPEFAEEEEGSFYIKKSGE